MTPREWTDDEMLQALRLRDKGFSFAEIARFLRRSRAAVQDKIRRIKQELKESEASA
ncbi:MAG: hypothetical protein AAF526_02080 [Pseudomonadota bacterium]